jgi:4-amino-4-deoxy-L-arabinose transferase-like glycosyltransferase
LGPVRWRSLALLLLLPGVLLYPCLSFLLFEPDEGRYAEIPREMLVRGEWVVPYLQGEPYLDKPPLLYWLVMGSYQLLGVRDWSARLVPALAVHGCVLLTYLLGRRRLGERAAFWGALALGLAPGFTSVGRLLVLDGLLALWITLALLAAFEAVGGNRRHRGWWLTAAFACGLGVLTKGPVAVVLVVPPLVAHRWLTGTAMPIGRKWWGIFAGVVLAVSLPWYAAVCLRAPAFGPYFFWRHNVLRFLTPFDHQEPVWFYLPILIAGLLPASLLLVPWVRFLISPQPTAAGRRGPALGYLLLAGGWCVLFFSLSGSKLPTYILPAFPPSALAVGHFLTARRWDRSRWARGTVGGMAVLVAAGHFQAIPWYARFHSPMSRPAEIWRYCGDRATPVVCYPRNCDSVAFYLGRDDLRNYRSKETPALLEFLQDQPRTVILFTHRHSPESLRHALPPWLHLGELVPVSRSWANAFRTEFCYLGVVERVPLGGMPNADARRP